MMLASSLEMTHPQQEEGNGAEICKICAPSYDAATDVFLDLFNSARCLYEFFEANRRKFNKLERFLYLKGCHSLFTAYVQNSASNFLVPAVRLAGEVFRNANITPNGHSGNHLVELVKAIHIRVKKISPKTKSSSSATKAKEEEEYGGLTMNVFEEIAEHVLEEDEAAAAATK
jgi:hypothetical protein